MIGSSAQSPLAKTKKADRADQHHLHARARASHSAAPRRHRADHMLGGEVAVGNRAAPAKEDVMMVTPTTDSALTANTAAGPEAAMMTPPSAGADRARDVDPERVERDGLPQCLRLHQFGDDSPETPGGKGRADRDYGCEDEQHLCCC